MSGKMSEIEKYNKESEKESKLWNENKKSKPELGELYDNLNSNLGELYHTFKHEKSKLNKKINAVVEKINNT